MESGVGDGVEDPKEDVMVHSGSASPMKTTPSASHHLTLPATTPALQAEPSFWPSSGDATGQDITHLTTDLTSNPDLTHPSTPSPADAEPPVISPANALEVQSRQASAWPSTQTPTTTPLPANGRTSGRKRTPKACDCCGPNSVGHNVRNTGRGRGRGRARNRGAGRDLGDTPKRKVGSQLTHIKSFDLKMVEEAENEDDAHEKVQMTEAGYDSQSQAVIALAVTSQQDGSVRNCVTLENGDIQKNKNMLTDIIKVDGTVKKEGGFSSSGAVRGRGGRGMMVATLASKMKVEVGIKRGGGVIIGSKMDVLGHSVALQRQEGNKNTDMEHGEKTDFTTVKSPFGNGDTVNLCDTEPEGAVKKDNLIMGGPGNGLLSILDPASRLGTHQELECEMQVDQISNETDQVSLPVTLSNGNIPTTTGHDHRSMPGEVDISHPPTVWPPNWGPIKVCRMQHHCALRDHMLYSQPGTWEKEDMEEVLGNDQSEQTGVDEKTQNKENLEHLTEMVHGKICFMYYKCCCQWIF